jgi:carboxypeptidase Q
MPKIFCRPRLRRTACAVFSAIVICLFRLPAAVSSAGAGQTRPPYAEIAERIRKAGLTEERAFEFLRRITAVGPRLTGSPEAAKAVEVTQGIMAGMGLNNIHLEPVTVNRWVRGAREEAEIVHSASRATIPLHVCALGGSVGTPNSGITAPVVEVKSFEELDRLGPEVRGKIVFFNRPMDRGQTEPFAAYGGAADQRVRGAVQAARHGGVAALVRSLTFRLDDFPHTGLMIYDEGIPRVPAAAVSTSDADALSALLKKGGPVSVRLKMSCRNVGPVESANVVGELAGTDHPEEIVLMGGHLDSWDLGTGAHDDGAGCAVSLEALRLIKDLGFRPKRTIRAVMFMDEEFGGTGGRYYVKDARRKHERHLLAMESDRGGFLPIGIAAGRSEAGLLQRLRALNELFKPLGVTSFSPGGGGVDVGPLIEQGTVPAAVIPNAQTYFDVHHSALDVLERVHPRELELQAVIMAILAVIVAQEGV